MSLYSYLYQKSSAYRRNQEKVGDLREKIRRLTAEKNLLNEKVKSLKDAPRSGQTDSGAMDAFPAFLQGEPHAYGLTRFDERLSEAVDKNPKAPAWAEGYVGAWDVRFLYNFMRVYKPAEMVEVGVASGFSTAVLLSGMETYLAESAPDRLWLNSYDIDEMCYFNPSIRVGSAVKELVPHLLNRVNIQRGKTAMDARRLPQAGGIDAAFVDADHDHPWPAFDVLALLPVVKPGGWILLHDIFLPFLHEKFQCCGANLLFSLWPGEKLLQPDKGIQRNVGAIRLFEDQNSSRNALQEILKLPWECAGPSQEQLKMILGEG